MKRLWRYWLLHLWYNHGYAVDPNGTTCLLCGRFIVGITSSPTPPE